MKKILSILYGIDDRFDIVKNTIQVCEPYFDKIHIVNSGIVEFEEKLKKIHNKVEIRTIGNYHGDKEFCWRAHYHGLDDGDWLLWLDSDERPSSAFLDDIDNIIEESELNKLTNIRLIAFNHYKNNGLISYQDNSTYEDILNYYKNDVGNIFLFDRFIKINKSETNPISVFGDHGFIMSNKEHHGRWKYKCHTMNHYKSDKQFAITCTLTMFFNPLTHFSDLDRINGTINSEEFKVFESFKEKTGIFTQNQFYKSIVIDKNIDVINDFKQMCNTDLFKNSKYLFNGMYNWVAKHDLDFSMVDYYCGKNCCKYKNIQL